MPRRLGLPSLYFAAAMATAATTAVPLAMSPASGLALRPAPSEPTRPYVVLARGRPAARALVGELRWRVRRYYTAALPGFATFLTPRELADLRADPRVRAVEPDGEIRAAPAGRPQTPSAAQAPGTGTTVYVVDSGLDSARAEFGDRAWHAFDATGGTGRDCDGHGTQVAGRVHDAAPAARIGSVRVLGCDGSGTLSDLLAGLDWIHRHSRGPSVATLSVDGDRSAALRTATRRLARSGVFVAESARSEGCRITPGGRTFSPYTPELAGAAAQLLELHPASGSSALATSLKCTAAGGVIRQNPTGAPTLHVRDGGF
ncbi:protease inhibitor I9 family protein [Nonomuraea maritima]|nr:protease inhibitor I9 family protein [Nonomuraea maritima]